MTRLNNFRLSYETAMLFVLSYEYNIAFARLLDMFNISDKIFLGLFVITFTYEQNGCKKSQSII